MSESVKHYRVTIQIQEVIPGKPAQPGPYNNSPMTPATDRRVHELLSIALAGQTEAEAYGQVIKVLETLRPLADVADAAGLDKAITREIA